MAQPFVQAVPIKTDSYKMTHWWQYPPDTQYVYSHLMARGGFWNHTLFSGIQGIIKQHFTGEVLTLSDVKKAEKFCFQHFGTDMVFLLTFGVQLLMYATPVIYPLSSISAKYRTLIIANPMTSIIETFKFGFLGSGTLMWSTLLYSTVFTIVLLVIGVIVFNKAEKSFTDTV